MWVNQTGCNHPSAHIDDLCGQASQCANGLTAAYCMDQTILESNRPGNAVSIINRKHSAVFEDHVWLAHRRNFYSGGDDIGSLGCTCAAEAASRQPGQARPSGDN